MLDPETFFLICIAVTLVCFVVFRDRWTCMPVPKRIWTYLSTPHPHPRLTACMDSWRRHHPSYEIVVLTPDTYQGYVTFPSDLWLNQRPPHLHPVFLPRSDSFSELLRLYVLAEHGGIWLDPTVEVTAPLDTWLFPVPCPFAAIHRGPPHPPHPPQPPHPPVLDTWLLAAEKGHPWVLRWRVELTAAVGFASLQDYVASRRLTTRVTENASAAVVAAQALLQQEKSPALWQRMRLWSEEDPIVRRHLLRGR